MRNQNDERKREERERDEGEKRAKRTDLFDRGESDLDSEDLERSPENEKDVKEEKE